MKLPILGILALSLFQALELRADIPAELKKYELTWRTPGRDASDSMPIGNGELAANVWVESNGDVRVLLARTDAWSENCRLLKLGQVTIRMTPPPFVPGSFLAQSLSLDEAFRHDEAVRDTVEDVREQARGAQAREEGVERALDHEHIAFLEPLEDVGGVHGLTGDGQENAKLEESFADLGLGFF